jgi:hypothetical protein
VPGFDNTVSQSWVIADFSNGNTVNGVQGVSVDKFSVDTSGLQNDLGTGAFTLSTDALSNQLILTFNPVPEPAGVLAPAGLALAGAVRVSRRAGGGERRAPPNTLQ